MFKFRLDFLLRFRRQLEELAKYELAERVRRANLIETRLLELRERSGQLVESMQRKADDPIPAPLFSMYKDYLDQLRREKEAVANELTRAEDQVEKQRQALVQASVERKVIDRLKERQKQAYMENEARQQQGILDELAALARSRRIHEEYN